LAEAQFNLAQRYQHGQEVASNLVAAYKWFTLAGQKGIPDAKQAQIQLQPLLSSEQIAQAEAEAAAFRVKSSPGGRSN
jgi:TPR repeat protein